jgi:hypothetical protein
LLADRTLTKNELHGSINLDHLDIKEREKIMTKKMKVVTVREVKDAQVLTISAATYKGSEHFSGAFRVWDLDHCFRKDDTTGQIIVTVFCQLGNAESDDPDAELEFEFHDVVPLMGLRDMTEK